MKKWLGNFIFDFVVKYVQNLGPYDYERLFTRIERPMFCRLKPLPESDGRKIQMYRYSGQPYPLQKPEGMNPEGPRFL
jgi:hypothetical protein